MPSKKTKKKLKLAQKSQQSPKEEVVANEAVLSQTPNASETTVINSEVVGDQTSQTQNVEQTTTQTETKQDKKPEPEKKDAKKDKNKEKQPSKLKRKTKEVFSELKKVTWPTAGQVAKKTAVVLSVVAVFAVALLGIDKVLELVYNLFISNIKG